MIEERWLKSEILDKSHPRDSLLRAERLPHIWCPGCGIGTAMLCLTDAIAKSQIPSEKHIVVSGIGCTSRIPGYLNLDTYHTTHGRAIPFATGIKITRPDLEVTVIAGDGDLFNIGGNHIIHAARRNMDLNVICVNNFNYGMTGGQHGSTTPFGAFTGTTPYGNYEHAFNLPHLLDAIGASYIARWTTLHIRQLTTAFRHMFEVKGLAFVEVISPCPPTFGELNNFPQALDQMEYFRKYSVVNPDADLDTVDITMRAPDPLIVGDFVNRRRPSYDESEQEAIKRAMGGGKK